MHVTGSLPTRQGELTVLDPRRAARRHRHRPRPRHPGEWPTAAAPSRPGCAAAGIDLILHATLPRRGRRRGASSSPGAAVAPTFTFLANLADHGDRSVGADHARSTCSAARSRPRPPMLRERLRRRRAAAVRLRERLRPHALRPLARPRAGGVRRRRSASRRSRRSAAPPATAPSRCGCRWAQIGVIAAGRRRRRAGGRRRPCADVTVLGDKRRLRHVFSRGRAVDLTRPWPTRSPLAGGEGGAVGGRAPHVGAGQPVTEVTVSTYEGARDAFRQKQLRQALYDEGEVVMADVLVNLHGDEHRARRRLENRLFRRDTQIGFERDLFPPIVAETLAPHRLAGRAELVSLSHQLMMNLAALAAGVDRPARHARGVDAPLLVPDVLHRGRHPRPPHRRPGREAGRGGRGPRGLRRRVPPAVRGAAASGAGQPGRGRHRGGRPAPGRADGAAAQPRRPRSCRPTSCCARPASTCSPAPTPRPPPSSARSTGSSRWRRRTPQ